MVERGQDLVETTAHLAEILRREIPSGLRPPQPEAMKQLLDLIEILQQGDRGTRRGAPALLKSPQSQARIGQQPAPDRRVDLAPGGVELLAFVAAQRVVGDGFGESQTVLLRSPRQGHQTAHRRLRGDGASPDSLLHGLGEVTDQSQTARDPAGALVQAPGELVERQTLP